MQTLDIVVIVLFSLLILVAGLSFGRKGKDMKSFFAAGGNVPWQINGLSLFMSFFSAGTFVVWGSIAYQYGFVSVTIQWMMAIGGILIGLYIAPRWKKMKILTAGEFIGKRLGLKVQRYYTYLILLLSLGYTGAFLYPVAKLVNVSAGVPINTAIIALGLLVIIYTAVGGLWAVVITDVLQFVILTAAVLIVVPLSFDAVGGLNEFINNAPATFFNFIQDEYNGWFLFAFAVYNMIFIGGNWAYVQRYTTVRTMTDARKVGFLFGGLYIISPLFWMLPPMIYRVLESPLPGMENEGAYLLMCKAVLPAGMLGLMIGGMVFATASSVNTTLNLVAAVFTNDIFKPLKPQSTQKQLMNIARGSTIVAGLVTILIALLVPFVGGIVEVVLTIGAVTGCSIYGPPVWALFSKHHNGKSIWACTIISLIINLSLRFVVPVFFNFTLSRGNEMLVGALLPFFLLGCYEWWARRFATISMDFKIFQLEIEQQNKIEKPMPETGENRYGVRVLAFTLTCTSFIIIALGFLSTENNKLVVGIGLIILMIATILLYNTKMKKVRGKLVADGNGK